MKTTRLFLLTMLLTFVGVSGMSAQEPYCAVDYGISYGYPSVTVTFYYDNQRSSWSRTVGVDEVRFPNLPSFVDYMTIVFDSSFADYYPTSTAYWFSALPAKARVRFEGWENLNTSQVTNMCGMFQSLGYCYDPTNEDESNYMVENFDLSYFDTSNVTDMSSMLNYVSGVDDLDISSFTIIPGADTSNMMANSEFRRITIPATAYRLADTAFEDTPFTGGRCELVCPHGFNPLNHVVNGNCESDDATSLWGHDYGNSNYQNGANTHFVEGEGYEHTRGIKVQDTDNSGDDWDATFYVYTPDHQWKTGEKFRFKMKVRADKAAKISVQAHTTPTGFLTYDIFDWSYDVTTQWSNIEYEGVVTSKQNNMQTIAFNLNVSKKANVYYFDNISWETIIDSQESFRWKGGRFIKVGMEAYAAMTDNGRDKILNFYYDDLKAFRSEEEGTTVYELNEEGYPGWRDENSDVTTVVFDSSFDKARPTSCFAWFDGFSSLTDIEGIENFHTDNVTNMAYMFAGCSNLEFIDLGNFVTTNTTDMYYMFSGCSSLTNLDVSNFVTSKVWRMDCMFQNCSSLTYLDVSGFDTSMNEGSNAMFSGCSSLTSLDVSNFDTAKSMYYVSMFKDCSKLESLDISNFTIPEQNVSYYMMSGCTNLKTLSVPATANRLDKRAFCNQQDGQTVGTAEVPCTLICPDGFTPDGAEQFDRHFTWKGGYFTKNQIYAVLSTDGKKMTFYFDENKNSRPNHYEKNWQSVGGNVKKVVFDRSFENARPTNCNSWFSSMSKLTSITGMEYLNTSYVTDMAQMFSMCTSLTNLDLSHFDTSKVTDMSNMFNYCRGLTSLDVSNFNTDNVTSMSGMFYVCSSLPTVDLSSFNTENVTNMNSMFVDCREMTSLDLSNFTFSYTTKTSFMLSGCSSLKKLAIPLSAGYLDYNACNNVGTSSKPCALIYPEEMYLVKDDYDTYFVWKGGYFAESQAYAVLTGEGDKTLTFFFDLEKNSREGTVYELNEDGAYPGWMYQKNYVANVVFDPSFADARPTTCNDWFFGMQRITHIEGLEYLNTSKTTSMNRMFRACYKLESLDLSNFVIPENATEQFMIYNESLKTLTLPETAYNFDSGAFEGVGTAEAPCILCYPDNLTLDKTLETNNYFVWKGGYFTDSPIGDVNGDGFVTVADVMMTVNYVIDGPLPGFNVKNADASGDGIVTVADVMAIVNIVMN